jgi:hypothetical protein
MYTGEQWGEVLAKLHKDQLCPEKTDARYMRAVARRVKLWNGAVIRTDIPGHFLLDLYDEGLIHIEQIL